MTYVDRKCDECGHGFQQTLGAFNQSQKRKNKQAFCSYFCTIAFYARRRSKKESVKCLQCDHAFEKTAAQIRKSPNHFCSRTCAGRYNNTHKTSGNRRSKLEGFIETCLRERWPQMEIQFNRKDTIDSELDVYVPSLKLAFELNGIFHYEPIFGPEKLSSIQNNDCRKYQACLEHGIELCLVDTSSMKYFKPDRAKIYADIVCGVIERKLSNV